MCWPSRSFIARSRLRHRAYGPHPAEIQPAAQRVKARIYDSELNAPRPAEHRRGRLGERGGAGGPGLGAVDPGEHGALTDWMTADCGGVGPNITCVGRASVRGRVDHSVAGLTLFRVNPFEGMPARIQTALGIKRHGPQGEHGEAERSGPANGFKRHGFQVQAQAMPCQRPS